MGSGRQQAASFLFDSHCIYLFVSMRNSPHDECKEYGPVNAIGTFFLLQRATPDWQLVCTAATTYHNDAPAHYEEGDRAHANTDGIVHKHAMPDW
jgi:hypothetical protein